MVEVASYHLSELGEGPVWDDRLNRICWIDIRNGHVHELDVNNNQLKTIQLGKLVGSIALCDDGNLLVAKEDGLVILDRYGHSVFYDGGIPPHSIGKFRFNDGKCDAAGRFWIGTMSDHEVENAGSFYLVDGWLKFEKVIEQVTIPNGMAWSKERNRFFFIDTPKSNVMSYSFDTEYGRISDPRIVFSIPESEGYPDGMTIDEEGMLWIAHWGGWQVTRWDPIKGKKLLSVNIPTSKVTSCTFGGKDLNDLYITTARTGLSERQLKDEPLAGSLFVFRNCGFKGLPTDRFITRLTF